MRGLAGEGWVWGAGRWGPSGEQARGAAAEAAPKVSPGAGFKPPTATAERGRQEAPLSARPPCAGGGVGWGGARRGAPRRAGAVSPHPREAAAGRPGRGRSRWRWVGWGRVEWAPARGSEPPPDVAWLGSARAPAAALAPAGLRRSGRPAALRGWAGEGTPAVPHPPPRRAARSTPSGVVFLTRCLTFFFLRLLFFFNR